MELEANVYFQLFVGRLVSYLRFLRLFTYSGVQHILFCFSLSCSSYVVSFSGLSILIAPSVFSNVFFHWLRVTWCHVTVSIQSHDHNRSMSTYSTNSFSDSYEKKFEIVMVNNSTNINKTNNHLLLQLNEHKKDHGMTLQFHVLAWYSHNIW